MNQVRAESVMPSSARAEKKIWRLTLSNTEDKSKRKRTDELDEALEATCGNKVKLASDLVGR